MPAAASMPVKSPLVNWLPWSVLKISGLPNRASAPPAREAEPDIHRVRQPPRQNGSARPVDDRYEVEKSPPDRDVEPAPAKAGVISAAQMAAHYDTAIRPARPRRRRDKAKVEAAVLIIERWLLGRLRHRRFYSLAELNAAIGELLRQINDERPIRRLGVTRRALLEELDRPHLKPLPAVPYAYAEWRLRRVGIDYHVEVEARFYSVPYRFARLEVEVRLTPRTVEIFLKAERIAAHLRSSGNHRHTTVADHMPSSHRRYADWTVERIRQEAAVIGPAVAALCELILERRPHPEQGFRSCLGIVRLYGRSAPSVSKQQQRAPSRSAR